VHFLVTYNKLSETCCKSSRTTGEQRRNALPYADAEMHPDREDPWRRGGRMPYGTIGTVVNPPLVTG